MRLAALITAAVLTAPQAAPAQRQAMLPWWDRAPARQVGHYWVKTDLPPERADALARHLNRMHAEYTRRLASLPQRAPMPLNVLIFERQREYVLTLQERFGVKAEGTGGMFFVNEVGSALAFWTGKLAERRIEHVAQHEGFHQFAWSRFGSDLPVWVNEGLAEFFGEAVFVGGRLILGQTTPRVLASVRDAIEAGTTIPFDRLLAMSSDEWRSTAERGAALQYNQSWSMVHFLVYGDGGRYVEAFEGYLRLLNQGVPSRDAFARAFGADIGPFEARWKEVASRMRPSAFITAMERAEFLAEGALELSRRNLVPGSLEELRAELGRIEFTHTLASHGLSVVLRHDDASLYEIPQDDLTPEPPVFVVEKPNVMRLPFRLRRLEEEQPTPPTIRTKGLRPANLEIQWMRDEETFDFSYDFRAR